MLDAPGAAKDAEQRLRQQAAWRSAVGANALLSSSGTCGVAAEANELVVQCRVESARQVSAKGKDVDNDGDGSDGDG